MLAALLLNLRPQPSRRRAGAMRAPVAAPVLTLRPHLVQARGVWAARTAVVPPVVMQPIQLMGPLGEISAAVDVVDELAIMLSLLE